MRVRFTNELLIDPQDWRASVLTRVLRLSVFLGAVVYVPSVYLLVRSGFLGIVVIDTIALAAVVALLVFDRLPYRWRAASFCAVSYMLGAALLLELGSESRMYLQAFSIVTVLLLGLRPGLYAALLSSATLLLVAAFVPAVRDAATAGLANNLSEELVIALNFTLVNTMLTLGIGAAVAAVENALQREIRARTALKQAETERIRLLTQLQLQIERMPLAYLLSDRDFHYARWNPAAERLFGYTEAEALGKHPFELIIPEASQRFVAKLMERVRGGDMNVHGDFENRTKAGGTITCLWHHTPMFDEDGAFAGILSLAQDVTERNQLEEQLRQAQKMEAVGQLAGGVAHDFNNLLTVILGYSEVLLAESEVGGSVRESATAINDAGGRASSLTRQLLAFSRRTILEPKVLDLNAVVGDTSSMLRRLIGEDMLFTTTLDPAIDRVRVDPGQLDQVLMNLAVNARDAMPAGGRLTIETANVELSPEYAATHPGCTPGPHVMLAVTDTGCGMTPDVIARIFEPFFTTKDVGTGTGLGLAMVFGIVQQSGGTIHVYSEPGHGTTFKVYFPAVASHLVTPRDVSLVTDAGGTETILLVEDDEAVRGLALAILQARGYRMLSAIDGDDALRVAYAHEAGIDLLLTDVVMPNRSGPELADALRTRFPDLKVLFMSGYTDDAVVRHGLLHAEVAFIQKPYTPHGLARRVRQVLDEVGVPVA